MVVGAHNHDPGHQLRCRRDDASYRAELEWWTSAFALTERRRPEVAVDWAKILVLSTPSETRADALRCGEVLSTVLLECTMAFMATCTLTHLIELHESREIVRGLLDNRAQPQVLIRAGMAPPMEAVPPPTPRRPPSEVLRIR